MKNTPLFSLAALLIMVGLSDGAAAASFEGYAGVNLNVRSGPNVRFPAVGVLGAGSTLTIHGCLTGYRWCDVSASGIRGWASGAHLQFNYETRRVYVPAYAPRIEMPIVTFHIDTYWHDYYRELPLYSDLPRWVDYHWEDDTLPPGWRDNWDDDYFGHEYE
ncbi:SH3 domain-containing protein [Bradyrhizobium oligotrophicum]|uniref:SH3 domain-containing protein n=1 Tax=Bradyrhizobium oligotrophicum TaxID=44255 RepID=UPI003EBB822F